MADEKGYYVYMHIFPNDKKYIGITCQELKHRWRSDGSGYRPRKNKNASKVWNAILKYGWDNVEHIILYEGLSREDACQKECELIKYYNTRDDRFGYNIALGGDVHELSEETRKKISEARKGKNYGMFGENAPFYGKHHSEDAKQKISNATRGENNPNYGKPRSDETKQKTMISHLSISKAVEQYDKIGNLIGIYWSIHEATRQTGVNRSCIQAALNGSQKTAGGFIWKKSEQDGFMVFQSSMSDSISY
jgi:group I intron endonuclease